MKMPTPEPPQPKDFAQFLEEFAHGSLNNSATEQLRDLVAACIETGQKGSITIKIGVDVNGKLAELKAAIKTSKPQVGLPGEVMFTGEDGTLHHEDPRQMKLSAKILDIPQSTPRIVTKEG